MEVHTMDAVTLQKIKEHMAEIQRLIPDSDKCISIWIDNENNAGSIRVNTYNGATIDDVEEIDISDISDYRVNQNIYTDSYMEGYNSGYTEGHTDGFNKACTIWMKKSKEGASNE